MYFLWSQGSFQRLIVAFQEVLSLLHFSQRQIGIVQLSHAFIDRDRRRIGEVQAPAVLVHRDPEAVIEMCLKDIVRNSRALLAEDEIDVSVIRNAREINGGMRLLAVSRHEEETTLVLRLEFFKALIIIVVGPRDMVGRCPLELFVVDIKPERTYQMKAASRRDARPHDISRILRYLRLEKDDVHASCHQTAPAFLAVTDAV